MAAAQSHNRRSNGQDSSSSSSDCFEFSTASTSDMCAADDVILDGKLLPFRAPPSPHVAQFHRLELPRGFEYLKLKRVSGSDPSLPKARPRWYVLVFGLVRVPVGMEIKEIRTRQRRPRKEMGSGQWGPWKLLQSLSCKGIEAVVVA